MELRKICDDTKDMGMWELAHNMAFVKNGEVWYRDFERELTARDLVREIYRKYVTTEDAEELADDETFDDIMLEAGYYGTDEMEGVCSILYTVLWGAAELREWLKTYETTGLPTTAQPVVLKQAIEVYGTNAQVDVAIEEMSELTKDLCKNGRGQENATHIAEEIADVEIMLCQMKMLFDCGGQVETFRRYKLERLAGRIEEVKG